MEELLEKLEKQNMAIIKLLGKIAFDKNEIYTIVTHGKRNPKNYVKVYNALNGEKEINELAKIGNVNRSNITRALQDWQAKGIAFNLGDGRKSIYIGLCKL